MEVTVVAAYEGWTCSVAADSSVNARFPIQSSSPVEADSGTTTQQSDAGSASMSQ
jgi:hypothetical protein